MGNILLGYCGLDCGQCPVYIATINSNTELKRKTAKKWSIQYQDYLDNELTEEELICHGCKSVNHDCFIGCQNCSIRKCCLQKNNETCADCNNFNKCEMILGFFTMHKEAKDNLNKRKDSSDA